MESDTWQIHVIQRASTPLTNTSPLLHGLCVWSRVRPPAGCWVLSTGLMSSWPCGHPLAAQQLCELQGCSSAGTRLPGTGPAALNGAWQYLVLPGSRLLYLMLPGGTWCYLDLAVAGSTQLASTDVCSTRNLPSSVHGLVRKWVSTMDTAPSSAPWPTRAVVFTAIWRWSMVSSLLCMSGGALSPCGREHRTQHLPELKLSHMDSTPCAWQAGEAQGSTRAAGCPQSWSLASRSLWG